MITVNLFQVIRFTQDKTTTCILKLRNSSPRDQATGLKPLYPSRSVHSQQQASDHRDRATKLKVHFSSHRA